MLLLLYLADLIELNEKQFERLTMYNSALKFVLQYTRVSEIKNDDGSYSYEIRAEDLSWSGIFTLSLIHI